MKLLTEITIQKSPISVSQSDKVMLLGSCFSDNIGRKMEAAGFDVCINPFGTLYNPASIANAVSRLDSHRPFCEADCVEMGAGAGRICSYEHHTSFARSSAEEFLSAANQALDAACNFWNSCNKVVITLGTAWVWKVAALPGQPVASNCLKRPACEFLRELLSLEEIESLLASLIEAHPEKEFIFTVSPIRHMSDGAHANSISKASLLLGIERAAGSGRCAYFPAYEIMMDELRDYRFYAEDLVHPRNISIDHIWEKFLEFCLPSEELPSVRAAEKAWRQAQHRQLL